MTAPARLIPNWIQTLIRGFFKKFGYEILKMGRDYGPEEMEIFATVRPFTGAFGSVTGPDATP